MSVSVCVYVCVPLGCDVLGQQLHSSNLFLTEKLLLYCMHACIWVCSKVKGQYVNFVFVPVSPVLLSVFKAFVLLGYFYGFFGD